MKQLSAYLGAASFIVACAIVAIWDAPIAYLTAMLSGMGAVSYISFVTLLVVAVVFMPLSVMPIIPLAASIMGPLTTAILSIIGWTIGSVIAFLIARHLGRPILERFVSLEKIDSFAESLPQDTRFLMIVLIRLTIPVDIASYALGLGTQISLLEYTAATVVGVAWFSFAFAYLGNALLTGNMPLLIGLGGISLLIFLGGLYWLKKRLNKS